MDIEEATKILSSAIRSELRDHAFGDMEVTWTKDGIVIADGGFGSSMDYVTIGVEEHTMFSFKNADARKLMSCGTLGKVGRNDETGPDEFVEGQVMPGLTTQGVFDELTK